jgi:hypothetical protein
VKRLTTLALLLVLGSPVRPTSADSLRRETLGKISPTAVQIVVVRDGMRLRTGSGVVIASRPAAIAMS